MQPAVGGGAVTGEEHNAPNNSDDLFFGKTTTNYAVIKNAAASVDRCLPFISRRPNQQMSGVNKLT